MRPSAADITEYRGRENADVVICQAMLEHVADTPTAFAGLASILKKGGVALLFAPSRNSLFARVNLCMPERLKSKLLGFLYPELEEKSGFRAATIAARYPNLKKWRAGKASPWFRKRPIISVSTSAFLHPFTFSGDFGFGFLYLLSRERGG